MDSRVPLAEGYSLAVRNNDGGVVRYTLHREIGRGGSCIVYDASYRTNAGDVKHVRIKECYPYRLKIRRAVSGELQVAPEDRERMAAAQEKMRSDFQISNRLFCAEGLFDSLTEPIDLYFANGTSYVATTFSPENTLARHRPGDLRECLRVTKRIAYALGRIHSAGYLYLDMKPENVLLSRGQTQRILLFDFDSLIPLKAPALGEGSSLRLSYSKGFAAVELQMARADRIGPPTDVYSVGALLFYLLFGRTPTAHECECGEGLDFSQMLFPCEEYADKLLFSLRSFFKNTLADYPPDRYQGMEQVQGKLEELEICADSTSRFLRSSVILPPRFFVGRSAEQRVLEEWMENAEAPVLCVYGMGGIGKSTLVKRVISLRRRSVDSLLYLSFREDLLSTLCDDEKAPIHGVERDPSETPKEYYHRKLKQFQSLCSTSRCLLVIDNYRWRSGEDLSPLWSIGWKVILIAREEPIHGGFPSLRVGPLSEQDALLSLFEHRLGRRVKKEEESFYRQIVKCLNAHTLMLSLVGARIAAGHLAMEEAATLARERGFWGNGGERIAWERDDVAVYETLGRIVSALFDDGGLSAIRRRALMLAALLGETAPLRLLQKTLGLETLEEFNALERYGIAEPAGESLCIHPVIREAVKSWPWSREDRVSALRMAALVGEALRERSREKREVLRGKSFLSKESASFSFSLLPYGEALVEEGKKLDFLRSEDVFFELLFFVLMEQERHREEFLLSNAELFLSQGEKLLPEARLRISERLVDLLMARGEREKASEQIRRAKKQLPRRAEPLAKGMLCDLWAGYYDDCLNGAYDAQTPREREELSKLLYHLSEAAKQYRHSRREEGKKLFVTALLNQATVEIRAKPQKKTRIDKCLAEAEKAARDCGREGGRLRWHCRMVRAWYTTLVCPSREKTLALVKEARADYEELDSNDLDRVDELLIPCADLMSCWELCREASGILLEGIALCDVHPESIPYLRKKLELLFCYLDVAIQARSFALCRDLLTQIEAINYRYRDLGIARELPEDLRRRISEGE